VRQYLIDIAVVIACALGLFVTTAWVQRSQERPVVEQFLHIIRQHGHITLEADRLRLDKARMEHAAGQSD
jgi:regulator of protease activity HflC (stomatin/prohibitin superfamily)